MKLERVIQAPGLSSWADIVAEAITKTYNKDIEQLFGIEIIVTLKNKNTHSYRWTITDAS